MQRWREIIIALAVLALGISQIYQCKINSQQNEMIEALAARIGMESRITDTIGQRIDVLYKRVEADAKWNDFNIDQLSKAR